MTGAFNLPAPDQGSKIDNLRNLLAYDTSKPQLLHDWSLQYNFIYLISLLKTQWNPRFKALLPVLYLQDSWEHDSVCPSSQ